MACHQASGRTLNQFALVSYIPEPLASFLDDLRLRLTPGCNPHAHLTLLPPRPYSGDVPAAIAGLRGQASVCDSFDVTLGSIEVFPVSNVIYLGISLGEEEIRTLHGKLNTGTLEHCCPYPFHPHVTIAQDFDAEDLARLTEIARETWATWTGSKTFHVQVLSFVKNVDIGRWDDLASVQLGPSPE